MSSNENLLFDDGDKKKMTKRNSLFSGNSSGLSKASKSKTPGIQLFGDPFASEPKTEKKESNEPKKISEIRVSHNDFLAQHPEIAPFLFITPITEFGLTKDQIRQRISTISAESYLKTKQCSPIIARIQAQIDSKNAQLIKQRESFKSPPCTSMRRRGLMSLSIALRLKQVKLIKKNLDRVSDIILYLGNFVNLFSLSDGDQELRILVPQIESEIVDFEQNDPKNQSINRMIKRIDIQLTKPETIDISPQTILNEAKAWFSQSTGYFPDKGISEKLLSYNIDKYSEDEMVMLKKRINIGLERPEAIGKAIIAVCNDFISKNEMNSETSLQFMFILFARFFFDQFYINKFSYVLYSYDISQFRDLVTEFRSLSPIGFGFSIKFLPERLRGVPLKVFPKTDGNDGNPYIAAVYDFEKLPFYTCPIEFCRCIHEALKKIQETASNISFNSKTEQTGMLVARSDHLLCLDDLFDISIIILLLSNPITLKAQIELFEPYIEGLEMTAELEFAFTNISAMIRHICEIDLKSFLTDAKKRTTQAMEIDPLRILQ